MNWFTDHMPPEWMFGFEIRPMIDAGTYRPGVSITSISKYHAGDSFRKQPCTFDPKAF